MLGFAAAWPLAARVEDLALAYLSCKSVSRSSASGRDQLRDAPALHQHWQEMGALEGVAGVLMFGVSTAYMFFVMQLYLPEIHAIRRH